MKTINQVLLDFWIANALFLAQAKLHG